MRPTSLALPVALVLTLASSVRAADWRQFRRDATHTAASPDKLPGPLTDVWVWEPGPFKASRPFKSAVIWKDRLFAYSKENGAVHLVCVDARTGRRYWQQPVAGPITTAIFRPDVSPAISAEGMLFAQGTSPFARSVEEVRVRNSNRGNFRGSDPPARVELRSYDALTGRVIFLQPMPSGWSSRDSNPWTSRIFLTHSGGGSLLMPPGERVHWRMTEPFSVGPLLLSGTSVYGVTWNDVVAEWPFTGRLEFTRIAHTGSAPFRDMTQPARMEGFPPVELSGGIAVGDDAAHRFIGVLFPRRAMTWHWDIPWSIGVPSTQADRLFLGIGGRGAHRGLIALRGRTGEILWKYPDVGPPADLQGWMEETFWLPTAGGQPLPPDGISAALFEIREPPFRTGGGSVGPTPAGRISIAPLHYSRTEDPLKVLRETRIWQEGWSHPVPRAATPGHLNNCGLVLARGRVYGWAAGTLGCFEQDTGRPIWLRKHGADFPVSSLVAANDELIACQEAGAAARGHSKLWAVDLETGALKWAMRSSHGGQMAVGRGLLFLSNGDFLTAFAPAERTFRMAVDSEQVSRYHPDPAGQNPPEPPAEVQEPCRTQEPEEPLKTRFHPELAQEDRGPAALKGLADATLLRLDFSQPLDRLLQAARTRRRTCGELPRVLLLDWFTPDRTARRRANHHGVWDAATTADFLQACQRLAAEFQPDHFELASDVNVYLAYHPTHVEEIRSLLKAARQAIRKGSPRTRTLVSFNAEVLNGTYGRGRYFPFRDVPRQPDAAVQRQLSLLEEVDDAGLTTLPQSGNIGPEQVLPTYLPGVAARLGTRPLLVTRVSVTVQDAPPTGTKVQAAFLKRIQRSLYWLNASVVAYPELDEDTRSAAALRIGVEERPALEVWKEMLRWRRVRELTASKPALD